MNNEETKELKRILKTSRVVTEKSKVLELSEICLPIIEFNNFREKYINRDYDIHTAIYHLVETWRSFKGNEASLENFAAILSEAHLNLEAGKL